MGYNQRPNPDFGGQRNVYPFKRSAEGLSEVYIYSGHVPISIGW